MGIKSPDSHYILGKIKGKTARDKGVEVPKSAHKDDVFVKKVDVLAGYNDEIKEAETDILLERPSLNELPEFIKKIRSSEIPGLLEGSKRSKRKGLES